MIKFSEIINITNGESIQGISDKVVKDIIVDSRNSLSTENSLFIAFKGINHNGHKYIFDLYNRGVRHFIIDENINLKKLPEANVIKVNSSLEALQRIAAQHRSSSDIPVIGVTGSNGKTIVKEWLFQLLSPEHMIVKSPKSYNSQIGVPLSVWQMSENHKLAIFEAGISKIDEMIRLQSIIQPTIGIFTNIGTAHDEGFTDIRQKIEEKSQLFKNSETVIHCYDHELIFDQLAKLKIKTFNWSKYNKNANVYLSSVEQIKGQSKLTIEKDHDNKVITVPFTDNASIENVMHCITVMLFLGYDFGTIASRAGQLKGVQMRLELKTGINNCQIVDDTYNNDLGGLKVALDFLVQQSTNESKTVILSDILQSSGGKSDTYQQVNQLLKTNQIDYLIGIGDEMESEKEIFEIKSSFYSSADEFLNSKDVLSNFNNQTILVKGARPFKFEKIVNSLVQKIHGTVLEINLNALTRNLNYYRSIVKPPTKLMVMVKALAYGSGGNEVANLLQYHKVDYLGVAYVDEGVSLRENGITIPIMVMNPSPESFDKLLLNNLEPEVYDFSILKQLITFLNGQQLAIHLKLDTGMRRLGFEQQNIDDLIKILRANSNLKIKSVFTHLASADEDGHSDFSHKQMSLFHRMTRNINSELSIEPILHALNSAGILRYPEYHLDMVRLGIGLYGVDTNNTSQNKLEPISRLKTVVSQIKDIKKGETIGYGRKGVAHNDMKIATLAIGYADGFNRAFSNGVGKVLINGREASVIGNVCMDMTMVDITNINASVGDDVMVFDDQLTISEVAKQIGTIPYEILTNVSERVKRVYYLD